MANDLALSPAFQAADAFTAKHEGGYTSDDGRGHAANFGIDQSAHPEVDVSHLTPDAAQQIRYHYWAQIGGDQIAAKNPALATAVYDTAIMAGPQKALELYAKSGDDPSRFMQLRTTFLHHLVEQNPQKYGKVAEGWANRDAHLGHYLGAQPSEAGWAVAAGGAAPAMTPPPEAPEAPKAEPAPGAPAEAKPAAFSLSPRPAPALVPRSPHDVYTALLQARQQGGAT